MKKFALFMGLIFSIDAYAVQYGLITSKELKQYEKDVQFLECVYSGSENCSQDKSIENARANLEKTKEGYSTGVNASRKKSLDAKAEKLLKKISVKEAKDFIKKYERLPQLAQIELMLDSAVIKTVMTTKSAGAIEAEAIGQKFNGPQTFTQSYSMTKQEALASAKAFNKDINPVNHHPDYFPKHEGPKVQASEEFYSLNAESTKVTCRFSQQKAQKRQGEYSDINIITVLVRDGNNDIRIASGETNTKTILKEVNPEDNMVSLNLDSFDVLDTKQDVSYSTQYNEQEAIARKQRVAENNILILEMIVDRTERLIKEASESKNESVKTKKIDEALKTSKEGDKYYSTVFSYKDDKAKSVAARYSNLMSRIRRAGL